MREVDREIRSVVSLCEAGDPPYRPGDEVSAASDCGLSAECRISRSPRFKPATNPATGPAYPRRGRDLRRRVVEVESVGIRARAREADDSCEGIPRNIPSMLRSSSMASQ